jgi:broad specificity phosphatase PhoE
MNDLLFVRHAETDLAGTFCGRSNPPVNAAGLRQIVELVETLRAECFDAVYASDLERAVTTAKGLSDAFAIPCFLRPALREIDFGQWEGLTWSEIEAIYPLYASQWLDSYPNLPAPGGESFQLFEARVIAEIDHLLSLREHRRIAVVTHAGVMRCVLLSLCGVGEREAWLRTKSYCCSFRYADGVGHMLEVHP